MTVGMVMTFDGVTKDDYEKVMAKQNLDLRSPGNADATDDWPEGLVTHQAGATGAGWCVVDTWDSQAAFDRFLASRLGPSLQRTGLPEPNVTVFEIYNSHA